MVVLSFGEANTDLIAALKEIFPLLFTLGYVHYVSCVSVFIQDPKVLPLKMPSLYREFKDEHFVVNTRSNTLSKTAIDQAQEHNKKIKSMSCYSDQDKRFLQRIELCWPEILKYMGKL